MFDMLPNTASNINCLASEISHKNLSRLNRLIIKSFGSLNEEE